MPERGWPFKANPSEAASATPTRCRWVPWPRPSQARWHNRNRARCDTPHRNRRSSCRWRLAGTSATDRAHHDTFDTTYGTPWMSLAAEPLAIGGGGNPSLVCSPIQGPPARPPGERFRVPGGRLWIGVSASWRRFFFLVQKSGYQNGKSSSSSLSAPGNSSNSSSFFLSADGGSQRRTALMS